MNHGVTTAVDAGSTGYANFPEFRRTVLDVPHRCLAFVHISFMGLHAPLPKNRGFPICATVETAAVIDRHRDRAAGVKIASEDDRQSWTHSTGQGLEAATDADGAADGTYQPGRGRSGDPPPVAPWGYPHPLFSRASNGMIAETVIPEARKQGMRGVLRCGPRFR